MRDLPRRVAGRPGHPDGEFEVPSRSTPGAHRYVDLAGARVTCDCPGFRHRRRCWHVHQALLLVRSEAQECSVEQERSERDEHRPTPPPQAVGSAA